MAAEAAFFAFITPSIKTLIEERLREVKEALSQTEIPTDMKALERAESRYSTCLTWSIILRAVTLTVFILCVLTILVIGALVQDGSLQTVPFVAYKTAILQIFIIYYVIKLMIWVMAKAFEYLSRRDFSITMHTAKAVSKAMSDIPFLHRNKKR